MEINHSTINRNSIFIFLCSLWNLGGKKKLIMIINLKDNTNRVETVRHCYPSTGIREFLWIVEWKGLKGIGKWDPLRGIFVRLGSLSSVHSRKSRSFINESETIHRSSRIVCVGDSRSDRPFEKSFPPEFKFREAFEWGKISSCKFDLY